MRQILASTNTSARSRTPRLSTLVKTGALGFIGSNTSSCSWATASALALCFAASCSATCSFLRCWLSMMLRNTTSNKQASPMASSALRMRSAPMIATPPARMNQPQTIIGHRRAMDVGRAIFSTSALAAWLAKNRPIESVTTQKVTTEITTAASKRMISPATMVGAAPNTLATAKANNDIPAAQVRRLVRTLAACGSTLIMRRPSALGANRNCSTMIRTRRAKNAIRSDITADFMIGGQSNIINAPSDPMAKTSSENSESAQSPTMCLRRSENFRGLCDSR